MYVCACVCVMIISTYTVDFSEDYEELSLHSTTFDKLQRKIQTADVIGKKKLASSEGVLNNFISVHTEHHISFRVQRVVFTSS